MTSARYPADPNDPYPETPTPHDWEDRVGPGPYRDPKARLMDREHYPFKGPVPPTQGTPSDVIHTMVSAVGGRFRPDGPSVLIGSLEDGEPIFVLRAADKSAAAVVRMWCELNALNEECLPELLRSVRELALAMERWPRRDWVR